MNALAIRSRILMLVLLGSGLLVAAARTPQAVAAAGHSPRGCAAHARHVHGCPAPRHAPSGHLYSDGYGDYLYVDQYNHHWLMDASGHLYFVDAYQRIWYVDPTDTFWYAAPDNSFWYYIAPDGQHGYVYPNDGGYSDYSGSGSGSGYGYVDPMYGSGSDPRWSSDSSGNFVTSIPGGNGVNDTIGSVDGCVMIGDEYGGTGC